MKTSLSLILARSSAIASTAALASLILACTATVVSGPATGTDAAVNTDAEVLGDGGQQKDSGPDAKTGPNPLCAAVSPGTPVKQDGGSTCINEDNAGTYVTRGLPASNPGTCTDNQREDYFKECLGETATQQKCDAYNAITANAACLICLQGPLQSTPNPASFAPPALIFTDTSVFLNSSQCGAVFTGNSCCGPLVSDEALCAFSACSECGESEEEACLAAAAIGPCVNPTRAAAACLNALDADMNWVGACRGADFATSYEKVTKVLCGKP